MKKLLFVVLAFGLTLQFAPYIVTPYGGVFGSVGKSSAPIYHPAAPPNFIPTGAPTNVVIPPVPKTIPAPPPGGFHLPVAK